MRKMYYSFITILFISKIITGQSLTGKLVDINGNGLGGLQVTVYTSPNYNTIISSSDGTFNVANVTTGIENDQLPSGYYISNNYPNPFNPKTRINIILPYKSNVKVDVFNILGQNVGRGVNKVFEAGDNYVILEMNGLPNGVYIARIDIDGKYMITKKMMLVYGSPHLSTEVNYANIMNRNSIMSKPSTIIPIDSIIVTGTSIKQNSFIGLPNITGNSLNLGNLIVNTTTTGKPCFGVPTITYAGKTYNTVKIGTQCWFKENLNVGTMIQSNIDQSNNSIIEKYCYNNDTNYCKTYGGLYQWAEALQYQNGATNSSSPNPAFSGNVQGICPGGWHIPTYTEFETLATTLNNDGNLLKAVGQGSGSGLGTNLSGFSALLAGRRDPTNNGFADLGNYLNFWCSTEYTSVYQAYLRSMYSATNNIYIGNTTKKSGFSIRCLKD